MTKVVPTPPGCVIAPAVGVLPSPQLIVAVKSAKGAAALASVKVATVWLPNAVEVTRNPPVAVKAASATLPVLLAEAVLPPLTISMLKRNWSPRSRVAASRWIDRPSGLFESARRFRNLKSLRACSPD